MSQITFVIQLQLQFHVIQDSGTLSTYIWVMVLAGVKFKIRNKMLGLHIEFRIEFQHTHDYYIDIKHESYD